ncbi:MAG: PHP domain-containing protein [Solirubrobacteraceae bacterium]
MAPPTFDLQSHSTHSDGALAPAEVVARAVAAGVELLALTDHDSVSGVDEALAAAREHGIRVVAATELSTLDDAGEDLHLLGYGIDHRAPAFTAALETFRADRSARGQRMADALRENGWQLDVPERESLGRPHLAAAAFEHPANQERIRAAGLATSSDLLVAELIRGAPSFRRRTMPTVGAAIDLVHAAGGVAVWAHPFWDVEAPADVLAAIDRFAAFGLDGVEAFYVTHTAEQTRLVADRCAELGLLTTGSADFHGPDHPLFSAFRAFDLHGIEPRLGPLAV